MLIARHARDITGRRLLRSVSVRVLMLAWDLPPHQLTGVSAHVEGLSRALARAGHDVVVLGRADGDADATVDQTVLPGVRVLRASVDLPWLPDDDVVLNTVSANHHLVRLLAELGDWRPDVVHAHDWNVAWAADAVSTLTGAPLVATIHATERGRHGGHVPQGVPAAINSVEWWLAWQARSVVCCSRFMMREVLDGFDLDAERVHLIPHGVDTDSWRPPDTASVREPLVLAWGRVRYEKGFQVLAQAMARLRGRVPGISCIIAGRGSYLAELQSQLDLEGVGDIVQIPGFVPDHELRTLLHRAGCVVIPSLYEPFGIVALEAMAADAPLVAARTGGLAEILEGTDAGLLFEPGNALRLAETIEGLLNDRQLADQLRANAQRLLAAHYSWDAIADTTSALYERVISGR